ncbi:semaphorin-7A-like isoform X2 [Sardina pilchardus]|uniref:semaphorin-7A-like isoform X2 n=1 Tax=Sardina pilchardus TaxID=27697 RepID=UPI002E1137B0
MGHIGFVIIFLVGVACNLGHGSHKARFKLTENALAFSRSSLHEQNEARSMKLFEGGDGEVYFGGGQHLSRLSFQANHNQSLAMEPVKLCIQELGSQKKCGNITVMQPGRNGYPLYVCTADGDHTSCCFRAANGSSSDCIRDYIRGGEPALLTGDALYTTHSGLGYRDGVYRTCKNKPLMPSIQADQRYVKIVQGRNEENPLQDKLYAFYTERSNDQSPDSDLFTPRVSQICKADLGGSKDTLQFQWTSQLSSRLSCGDPSRKLFYTELLDVAVLPSEDGGDDRVYGLFKNGWEIRAVCVYTMRDISQVFSTSALSIPADSLKEQPGQCVQDSRKLSPDLLKYMKNSPEMVDWVRPIGDSTPLLVSHRHYSHIQVDRVGGTGGQKVHNVLLLSMESGAVHKVLENTSKPFIIAEYHPFKHGMPIQSMLLHSSEKLYVSSSGEVVQIDLRNCRMYGNQCADCVLARDPYCGWDSSLKKCAPHSKDTIQDIEDGNVHKCAESGRNKTAETVAIAESSRHYLACPIHSHHAKYRWLKDRVERRQSLEDDKLDQLVLLIDGMESADEGRYECEAQEGEYMKTVVAYQLKMTSGAAGLKSSPLAVVLLAVLFYSLW